MSDHPTHEEQQKRIAELVNDIGTAMMVTHSKGSDQMHARPMRNAELADDFDKLWFATRRDSGKVDEIRDDRDICLTYCNANGSSWVSLTGTARCTDEKDKRHMVYSHAWDNWFDGPDDPNLLLIEVTPTRGEYWESNGKIMTWTKMAAAAVTGHKFDVGDNEKVDL